MSGHRIKAQDSPRWCQHCHDFGDHHTDRHGVAVERLRAAGFVPFGRGTWLHGEDDTIPILTTAQALGHCDHPKQYGAVNYAEDDS